MVPSKVVILMVYSIVAVWWSLAGDLVDLGALDRQQRTGSLWDVRCHARPFTWKTWLNEGSAMVGATVVVGAKRAFTIYLRLSGFTVMQYLAEYLLRDVFDDTRVAILVILLFMVSSTWAVNHLLHREIQAWYQEDERERAMARAVDREAIVAAMNCDRELITALVKRNGSRHRPTQVFLAKRRLEMAGRNA